MANRPGRQALDIELDSPLGQELDERLRPEIHPRSEWIDVPPTGPLEVEDDVRFLLVHHTASPNDYGPDEVIDELRDFHRLHTGPERGWADIAYNFLIDRYGGIWEGREGSIDRPIRGDATGGSQGHALLCSLIGNHAEEPPTPEALAALSRVLAWLGHRHRIDTAPGSTVEFVSRGSSRWPVGVAITARTISGHRDMSITTCPGDPMYRLIESDLPARVENLRAVALTEAEEAGFVIETPEPTTDDPAAATAEEASAPLRSESVEAAPAAATGGSGAGDDGRLLMTTGGAMVLAGLGGLIGLRMRRAGEQANPEH